jgi:DNA polymerase-4
MNRLGIYTGLDLRAQTMDFLQEHFGKSGSYYYWIARGIDERPVRANRIRHSIGAENTFSQDLTELSAMREQLRPLAEKVWTHCERTGTRGRTVTLKVKYADFQQITRSRSFSEVVSSVVMLESTALDLLAPLLPVRLGVRLLGVTLSALNTVEEASDRQLTLRL